MTFAGIRSLTVPRTLFTLFIGAVIAAAPSAFANATTIQVSVTVEPAQPINAIAISGADGEVHSIPVRDGKADVPQSIPLPWTVSSAKFEATTYTNDALEHQQTLLLRELAVVHGTLAPIPAAADRNLVMLLRRGDGTSTFEAAFTAAGDGTFEVRVPSGVYVAAILGDNVGTRMRSGIVAKPGVATDVGVLKCEPTIAVTMRILDSKTGRPIRHASMHWSPPERAPNADVAQELYRRRWSATTDARGIATFKSIGPLPMPVRWHVEATGYANAPTIAIVLTENHSVSFPDMRLRPEAIVVARIEAAGSNAKETKGASLVLSELQDLQTLRFTPVAKQPFREGEIAFTATSYGPKRLSVQTSAGKVIAYVDFSIRTDRTFVDVPIVSSEIRGVIRRKDEPADNMTVTLADPHDARVILAKAASDKDGHYRMTTYQSTGDLFLYAIRYGGQGSSSGSVSKTIHADGRSSYFIDFDLPNAGCRLRVVDAATGAPLQAQVGKRVDFAGGGSQMGMDETDAGGRLTLSGYDAGSATLNVTAKGHRSREMTLKLEPDPEETLVKLDASAEIDGQVADETGAPIRGARISGGFRDELSFQGASIAVSDKDGRFHIDSPPPSGTIFYISAARYALGITTLEPDHANVVVLTRPNGSVLTLRPDNAPPSQVDVVMAAPAGGEYIPLGVLSELAEVNGMNPLQLHSTARDGTVVLPEFLPPGAYDLFTLSKDRAHQRIGSINVPLRSGAVLAYKTK